MIPPPPSASPAADLADVVRRGFSDYRRSFRRLTGRARRCFEERDWVLLRESGAERLLGYRRVVDSTHAELRRHFGASAGDRQLWAAGKTVYSGLIAGRHDWDLAETFFNSISRRAFGTVGVDAAIEFVDTDFDDPPCDAEEPLFQTFAETNGPALVRSVLGARDLDLRWFSADHDCQAAGKTIAVHLGRPGPFEADVLLPTFFRGKGAYVVGRVRCGRRSAPIVFALRNGPAGVRLDAVLLAENEVSSLFGFTRSYFHVDTARPFDLVRFVATLLPRKRRGELYIAIGEVKHGKTELYRDLLAHLQTSRDRFSHAAGIPGLVMVVFGMRSWDMVVKVIRDRFEPALLEELLGECAATVELVGDDVVLHHAYVERRVTPLNLFLREVGRDDAEAAVLGFGQSIRDMAACGIFAGDLLPKNFGVTRNGRVAFYDYDELVELESCNFRVIPKARAYEDELAAEPWFSVAPNDVFPEEFPRFLGLPPPLLLLLRELHGELFDAKWWRSVQQRIADGKVAEFPPYPAARRLPPPPGLD